MLSLNQINKHPRDSRISMDEPTHVYLIDGKAAPMSGTTLLKRYMEPFNRELILNQTFYHLGANGNRKHTDRIARSRTTPHIVGMNREELIADWVKRRDGGSDMHDRIDKFLDIGAPGPGPDDPAFNQFLHFHNEFTKKGWTPYRSEWQIWHDEMFLPGTIDAVYFNRITNKYAVIDWKRSPRKFETKRGKMKYPLHDVPKSDLSTYSLQVCLYANILKKYYGIDAALAIIVQCKPIPGYMKPTVFIHETNHGMYPEAVQKMIQHRLNEIELETTFDSWLAGGNGGGLFPSSPKLQTCTHAASQ